jgi:organic radical activating enzyme
MKRQRHLLGYAEFYITNVCNFNCTDCNRFNNHYFSGQQKWEDYADVYKEWSKIVHFKSVGILGGEPMLNPTFLEWIDGIATLWPIPTIAIITNGTRLNKVKGLYDTLVKYKGRVWLDISVHNESREDHIINESIEFLDAIETNDVHGSTGTLTDKNKIKIRISSLSEFSKNALIQNGEEFSLRNSSPIKAFKVCFSKTCHHFDKGKLHKCGVTALLPEFYKQFYFNVSEKDKKLMHSYEPLTIDHSLEHTAKFMEGLQKEKIIPQCKFCPESVSTTTLRAGTDKVRIKKKKP